MSVTTDSRTVQNVSSARLTGDDILTVVLKQFQNTVEFDSSEQVQQSWMVADLTTAGITSCIMTEYYSEEIPDLKSTNQGLFIKLLIDKLVQKVVDLEARIVVLETA